MNLFKIDTLNFQIFLKKYTNVVNYIYYEHAKFKCEIRYIVASGKKTNLTKFGTCS
jgi:hypothetical protein